MITTPASSPKSGKSGFFFVDDIHRHRLKTDVLEVRQYASRASHGTCCKMSTCGVAMTSIVARAFPVCVTSRQIHESRSFRSGQRRVLARLLSRFSSVCHLVRAPPVKRSSNSSSNDSACLVRTLRLSVMGNSQEPQDFNISVMPSSLTPVHVAKAAEGLNLYDTASHQVTISCRSSRAKSAFMCVARLCVVTAYWPYPCRRGVRHRAPLVLKLGYKVTLCVM